MMRAFDIEMSELKHDRFSNKYNNFHFKEAKKEENFKTKVSGDLKEPKRTSTFVNM